ncbi:MAG: SUMF1/EgtB/PvdO family nonheme iron enzyme [Gomphosphaeria aponina SAG 52.96 = DSM 107014]|uniref:SUMF1/EgtB/PvdO family nonheme iron enzyme n=1 Tax=Gomphosphaeria aponina SAG 52.96 = DSM 107014 TaxID=1521640 RepID=A0A941JPK5_9CHRO|nr:SUMF1/EgtB/PvdO family nonheme iron enzyme [Gomphosphaeria aponina SAG 52.96 = DSM 107014]
MRKPAPGALPDRAHAQYRKNTGKLSFSEKQVQLLSILTNQKMNSNDRSSLTAGTKPIKIYEKTYQLPVLNSPGFTQLQQQIKERQQIIKADKRSQIKVFGFTFGQQEISFDQRFQELNLLIKEYNKIIDFLTQHKEAYQEFFWQLTDELKGIVGKKCQDLAQVEQERLSGLQEADDEPILLDFYQKQQQQIFRTAFVLYRATELMVKKVKLMNQSIQKLAEDQTQQKQLLEGMVGKLGKYKKAYALQQKINRIERDVNKLADVALNFENLMSDFLGPFQGLINQVVGIDETLSSTVEEIRILAGDILNKDSGSFTFDKSENISTSVIEFLMKGDEKKERIEQALSEAHWENLKTLEQLYLPPELLANTDLTVTLNSIQNDVNQQLKSFIGTKVGGVNSHQLSTINYQPLTINHLLKHDLGNGIILELVEIPAGSFRMGGEVQINLESFLMGKYPVTQDQWKAVMGDNPSYFKGSKRPVECVSWDRAQEFCQQLWGKTGQKFRLPSEAEWEYACRAGTTTKYFFGNDASALDNYAWFSDNSNEETHSVGEKKPNPWGLYDILGNVLEWCEDDWVDNLASVPRNGKPVKNNNNLSRVLRGGSYYLYAAFCVSATRDWNARDARGRLGGFRVALAFARTI